MTEQMKTNKELIQEIKSLITEIENILTEFHPSSTKRLGLVNLLHRLDDELKFLEYIESKRTDG